MALGQHHVSCVRISPARVQATHRVAAAGQPGAGLVQCRRGAVSPQPRLHGGQQVQYSTVQYSTAKHSTVQGSTVQLCLLKARLNSGQQIRQDSGINKLKMEIDIYYLR